MSNLPDLNTDQISWLAYYNVISQGGANAVEPETCLDYSRIVEYELYDNGFDALVGGYRNPNQTRIRMKTDGWVVAYIPSRNYQTTGTQSYLSWSELDLQTWEAWWPSTPVTNLGEIMAELINNLDNSGNINFNHADVGLYDYSEQSADNITHYTEGYGGQDSSISDSYTIVRGENTTVNRELMLVEPDDDDNGSSVSVDGTRILGGQDTGGAHGIAAVPLADYNLLPTASGESMEVQLSADAYDTISHGYTIHWS